MYLSKEELESKLKELLIHAIDLRTLTKSDDGKEPKSIICGDLELHKGNNVWKVFYKNTWVGNTTNDLIITILAERKAIEDELNLREFRNLARI